MKTFPRMLEEFEPHTYDQWKDAATALLKGAPFEKKLISKTYEGFTVPPILRREDIAELPHLGSAPGAGNQVRSAQADGYLKTPWLVSQELPYSTPGQFNQVALTDIQRGQTELNILLDVAAQTGLDPDSAQEYYVGGCGLSLATLKDLETALSGVDLKTISIYMQSGTASLPVAAMLLALAEKRHHSPAELKGCFGFDPLGSMAWNGLLPVSLDRAYRDMAALTTYSLSELPGMQTIEVNSNAYHNGGCNTSDEIAFALATGVEYLRAMQERGITAAATLSRMRFSMAIGGEFFMEIAKFRAARLLWSQVAKTFLEDRKQPVPFHLHARTGTWNKTLYDPYVNMLRTTTEAFSAVMGGCNSMHIGPFDEIIRVPNEFSRRIARNTHFILSEECEMTRTIDPAGGSWTIEWLTDQLARKAWAAFQQVEETGGMAQSLQDKLPQEKVETVRRQRAANLAKRRNLIVGTNIYPNATEEPLESPQLDYTEIRKVRGEEVASFRTCDISDAHEVVLDSLNQLLHADEEELVTTAIDCARHGATLGEISRTLWSGDSDPAETTPIPIRRAAMPFEQLRKSAECAGKPRILQANIGASRAYRMRADWTSAFFQVGGFDLLNDTDFETVDAAVHAAHSSQAPIVVITSTDNSYTAHVPELAAALKKLEQPPYIIVAGMPGDHESEWRDAGVDEFVNIRTNCYEMLQFLIDKTK
ncbi:MAG: methylmalonyl-CoA mutase family protein [Verrucomicrobiota bacterium]